MHGIGARAASRIGADLKVTGGFSREVRHPAAGVAGTPVRLARNERNSVCAELALVTTRTGNLIPLPLNEVGTTFLQPEVGGGRRRSRYLRLWLGRHPRHVRGPVTRDPFLARSGSGADPEECARAGLESLPAIGNLLRGPGDRFVFVGERLVGAVLDVIAR